MPDSTYVTAEGFVQFDPVEREANGKDIVEVVIRTPGGEGKNIRVTVWPEIELEAPLKKGDYIAVDGKFSTSTWTDDTGAKRVTLQISASMLAVLGSAAPREDRPVEKKSDKSAKAPF